MTKEQYFEMCSSLGTTPNDEEIPIEYEDLNILVQVCFNIYETLRDEWEYMGGNYIGKNLQNLFPVLDLYEIDRNERLTVYKILCIIDTERRAILREKNKDK